MEMLGISWNTAWIAFGVGTAMLTGLFFLKPRRRELQVPSVMLCAAAMPRAKYRTLFRRPARLLHFLLLLSLFAATIAALTEPVRKGNDGLFTIIAADPAALEEAKHFASRLNPLESQLISTEIAGIPDRSSAFWSAMQHPTAGNREKRIIFFGPDAPPWLPENSAWIAAGIGKTAARHDNGQSAPVPAFQLYFENEPETPPYLPSNMKRAMHSGGADAVMRSVPEEPEQWRQLLHRLRSRRGAYTDVRQHEMLAPPTTDRDALAGNSGTCRISTGLWFLALVLFAVDGFLFSRGLVV